MNADFWQDKRVLVTGHTGFKGGWLCLWLKQLGAQISGIALPPEKGDSFFASVRLDDKIDSHFLDICHRQALRRKIAALNPEIIFHLAAQPLVRASYRRPVENFATNVMGTLHVLDALNECPSIRTVLIITSDKVYENNGAEQPFHEGDRLGGDDPYSASKAAAEIAVQCWRKSFCEQINLITARAGNVIGGGDFAVDRLLPDAYRAWCKSKPLSLRHPESIRPWQHVLDVTAGYLAYAQQATESKSIPTALNFGPEDDNPVNAQSIVRALQHALGDHAGIRTTGKKGPPEKGRLQLDSTLARSVLDWKPRLKLEDAITHTADWYRAYAGGEDMTAFSLLNIQEYQSL